MWKHIYLLIMQLFPYSSYQAHSQCKTESLCTRVSCTIEWCKSKWAGSRRGATMAEHKGFSPAGRLLQAAWLGNLSSWHAAEGSTDISKDKTNRRCRDTRKQGKARQQVISTLQYLIWQTFKQQDSHQVGSEESWGDFVRSQRAEVISSFRHGWGEVAL